AVPVAAKSSLEALAPLVDEVACMEATSRLWAISAWYEDFRQTSDEEVAQLLERAKGRQPLGGEPQVPQIREQEINIELFGEEILLQGTLAIPPGTTGLVLFAHGSGSSRFSPRNRFVADQLQRKGLGTLLFDLLTSEEEQVDIETGELRFDIDFLARRLMS